MGKRKRYRPDGDNDPELDISSLVDVAFLLLIYFLVTSTLRPDETDLSIVLPSQVPNENPLDIDPIAIVIGPDGSVTYNEEPCLLYTSPSPRDGLLSRMPSSA